MNLTQKLIKSHLVSGDMTPGEEIALRIDQTLSQDATGTLSYLQFEAIGVPRVRTQLSVSYVDHNMLQGDFRNADDHVYLQDVAAKYGLYYSRPGNGICHQVHLERFAVPGTTLLGTDSHTPTCGGMGVLAIGAGGLDVAIAMAGSPYNLRMPRVLGVELHGRLQPGVTAKDIIFEILRRLTVKGGVGRRCWNTTARARPIWMCRSGRRSPTWGRNSAPPRPCFPVMRAPWPISPGSNGRRIFQPRRLTLMPPMMSTCASIWTRSSH